MSLVRRALATLGLLAALALAALAVALVAVPLATGSTPLTVISGSMAPAHDIGDIVVVRPAPPEQLRAGDVITYQRDAADPTLVTHRIESTTLTRTGETAFVTRGDANEVADAAPVPASLVRGEVWYAVPQVGRLRVVLGPHRDLVLVGTGVLLFLLWAGDLVAAGRRRIARVPARTSGPRPARVAAARPDETRPVTSSPTAQGFAASVI